MVEPKNFLRNDFVQIIEYFHWAIYKYTRVREMKPDSEKTQSNRLYSTDLSTCGQDEKRRNFAKERLHLNRKAAVCHCDYSKS